MVMARIRRMGKNWASCGVPVSPPPELAGNPRAKRLCPKLVPGQVITVPSNHNLLNQPCVEIVRSLERDEFHRPWAFPTAEAATLANPSKSRQGADQIAAGLALAEGAQEKGRKALAEREASAARAELSDRRKASVEDEDDISHNGPDEDGEDDYVPSTRNRMSRAEADELRKRDEPEDGGDEDPAREEEPAPRARRSPRRR
jgi:hypothetical protein